MLRSLVFQLILATFVLVSSTADNLLVQAYNKVSCSCTSKTDPHKVVKKTTICKVGMSKAKCCAKPAKAWPSSIKYCKLYMPAAPELGKGGAGQPSSSCIWGDYSTQNQCNTTAGSQCVDISGGVSNTPRCTCKTTADCGTTCSKSFSLRDGLSMGTVECGLFSGPGANLPHNYKGNVCNCLKN